MDYMGITPPEQTEFGLRDKMRCKTRRVRLRGAVVDTTPEPTTFFCLSRSLYLVRRRRAPEFPFPHTTTTTYKQRKRRRIPMSVPNSTILIIHNFIKKKRPSISPHFILCNPPLTTSSKGRGVLPQRVVQVVHLDPHPLELLVRSAELVRPAVQPLPVVHVQTVGALLGVQGAVGALVVARVPPLYRLPLLVQTPVPPRPAARPV